MQVLLLCNYDPYNAAMVSDHINAFPMYSRHDVLVFTHLVSNMGELPDDMNLDLFDAVIVHYSLFLAVDSYVSPKTREKLRVYHGVKAIFLQDEYRFVNASVERIWNIGFDVIFTCVPEAAIEQVYPSEKLPGVDRINVLTGYVPDSLVRYYEPKPLEKRGIDVSYRGRRYPAWHGRLGLEKWVIAKRFLKDAPRYRLRCSISYREKDRVYGSAWVNLLLNSKAVLGVESGASVFDFTGEISSKVETVVALRGFKNLTYEFLRENYFAEVEDKIPLAQISPRIFEAIALRTLCILYEGEYSGIMKPWRHYVPLKKDHSNMDEVVAVLRDPERMAEIVANAFGEIAVNPDYSYQRFIDKVDASLERRWRDRNERADVGYGNSEDVRNVLKSLRLKYPFFLIPNPHGLIHLGGKRSSSFIVSVKRLLPRSVKMRIRSLVR